MSITDDPWPLCAEAEALIDVGRHEQALEVLARAAASDPDAALPHLMRAQSLIHLKRFAEAHTAAREAITRDPESDHAYRLLAISQYRIGDNTAAKQTALRAVSLDPDEAMNYVVLGDALQATRDEAGALTAARHAIELAPGHGECHNLLGRLLLKHEDGAGAEAAFRDALALNAQDDRALNNLALALDIQGKRDEALAGIEAATRLAPADDLKRRNVLIVARRHLTWLRGVGIVLAIFGTITMAAALTSGTSQNRVIGLLVGIGLIALGALLFELAIHRAAARADGPTARLLLDDHRARRFKPWRWDWSWILRIRPWWWLVLVRIPPPAALIINIAAGLALPILLIGVPFSGWRAWRWYRRTHPGRHSWRPPD